MKETKTSDKSALSELLKQDAKALDLIQGAISDELFPRISYEVTTKGAWDLLQQEYRGDDCVRSVKVQGLRRVFEYTRMREDESLSTYLTRLFELINEIKSMGAQIKNFEGELSKNRIVQKLLMSLTKTYDPVCTVIEQTKDLDAIEVREVVATQNAIEQRLERHFKNTVERRLLL